jgi:hypothetical protein
VKHEVVSEWVPQPHQVCLSNVDHGHATLSGNVVGTSLEPSGAQFRHKVEAGLSLYIPSHPSRLFLAQ